MLGRFYVGSIDGEGVPWELTESLLSDDGGLFAAELCTVSRGLD